MKCEPDRHGNGNELELSEQFLSEFYGLHELNAKRIDTLSNAQRLLQEARNIEEEALAEDLLTSLSVEEPEKEIPRAFLRYTPTEMPQIYRTQGATEARRLLETLIEKEDKKPIGERNPCPYYNLAYICKIQAHSCANSEQASEHLQRGLSLIDEAENALEKQTVTGTGKGWRSRETLLSVLENLRAIIHLSQDDLAACGQAIARAICSDPDLPDAHFTNSVYLSKCAKYDDAILEMHKAIQAFLAQGRSIADPWFHLARIYYKKAQVTPAGATPSMDRLYDEAIACLQEATAIDKDFALAHLKLGLLSLRKDCESAIDHFDEALRSDIKLYSSIHRVTCPPKCKGCSGVRLKMLLMKLLSEYEEAFKNVASQT